METVTKTISQYSRELSGEVLEFLNGIAQDYCKVKNYVYRRYSGIKSLDKLTPVYDILTQMRYCGLRTQLDLPVVYYELAVTEAVTDIKAMWGVLKNTVRGLIDANDGLNADERMYIRTVLKINSTFYAVLNCMEYDMPNKVSGLELDAKKLNNLIRRLVRRHIKTPRQQKADNFLVSPAGYRYGDGGIYLVSRTPRKRVFIPLKDDVTTDRQIRVCISGSSARFVIPIDILPRKHGDYANTVYAYIGYRDMITLSNGNIYGMALNEMVGPETERLNRKNRERAKAYSAYRMYEESGEKTKTERIDSNNLGRKKYDDQKRREREKTQNYINAEINRMFREEKPARIVITKPVTKDRTKNYSKAFNRRLTRNFRGYIRETLIYKCKINSVELVEINSKGTGSICSECGSEGKRERENFICPACGLHTTIAANTAKNIEKAATPQNG